MILVSGTMRSGTSMWMQILSAAGLPTIGDVFPEPWGERLRDANRRGFYESQFIAGVYYATNPHPESGVYLFPEQARNHVVKVFIPGLLRSDVAFIDGVVGTVREWRQFAVSLERMRIMAGGDREAALFDVPFSASLRWWMENFALIRDVATRGYAAHVTTYDRLLREPEAEIAAVLDWIGQGDVAAAVAAVEPKLRTAGGDLETPDDIEPRHARVFDLLYEHLDSGKELSADLVALLNRTDEELRPRIMDAREKARELVLHQFLGPAPTGGRP